MLIAGLLYACGIALITLSPFSEWRFIPESPWEFLFTAWPRYWTGFDLLVNLLAYVPLGLLVGRAISYRLRGHTWGAAQALAITVALGLLLSLLLEGLQTYVPSRRPSVLDIVANGAGTFFGAFLSSAYAQNRNRLQVAETRPIEIGGLMLLATWLLAQAAPQHIWLALGDIGMHAEWRKSLTWFAAADPGRAVTAAAQQILAEALCVASAIISCALIVHLSLLESSRWFSRYHRQHWIYTLAAIVALTITVRTLWIFALLSPSALPAWFSAGTQAGLILALLSAYGLAGARPSQQRIAAVAALVVMLLLANSLPENGYAAEAFNAWSRGRWFNLQALANSAATLWPFAAMAWLFLVLTRQSVRALDGSFRT